MMATRSGSRAWPASVHLPEEDKSGAVGCCSSTSLLRGASEAGCTARRMATSGSAGSGSAVVPSRRGGAARSMERRVVARHDAVARAADSSLSTMQGRQGKTRLPSWLAANGAFSLGSGGGNP